MRKTIMAGIIGAALLSFAACSGGYTSDENCAWCGDTPTKEIKGNYYCESCVTTCLFCGEPATEEFTNDFGLESFVCDDCFAEIQGE